MGNNKKATKAASLVGTSAALPAVTSPAAPSVARAQKEMKETGSSTGRIGAVVGVGTKRTHRAEWPKSKYVLRTKNFIDTVISSMLFSYLRELDPKEARSIMQEIVKMQRGVESPLGSGVEGKDTYEANGTCEAKAECGEVVFSSWTKMNNPNIRSIIDGALLADLIDKARDYFIEQMDAFIGEAKSEVSGISGNGTARTDGSRASGEGMSCTSDGMKSAIRKTWESIQLMLKNLSGVEYVTRMPFEMAEVLTDWYEEMWGRRGKKAKKN